MSQTITKLYDSYAEASAAVTELERIGIPHKDISIIVNNGDGKVETRAGEDAGIGAGAGATIGGVGGLLAGLGILAIPGLGPIVAAGWLATTALGMGAGAVVGGAAGGLIGALQKEGVSEDDAHVYSEGVRRGGTLVSVKAASDRADEVRDVLDRYRPVNPAVRRAAYSEKGWSNFDENAAPYTADEIEAERALYPR